MAVYFIHDSTFDRIKIGKAINPKERLGSLRTKHGPSLSLLAVIPGGLRDERNLHWRFRHLRLPEPGREWYRPELELVEFIASVKCDNLILVDKNPNVDRLPPKSESNLSDPMGPLIGTNLIRLGYSERVVKQAEIARRYEEAHGRSISRQRIYAILNAVRVSDTTIAELAEALGVKPAELLKRPKR